MTPTEYDAFIAALQRNLEADPRVLGLVAVGSMARRETRPDAWSDHDFLVIVTPGVQEEFRDQIGWLPDAHCVAYRFRETAHGVKLLYEDGHLLEFAIFDRDELLVARIDQYRVLLDRADIGRRMDEVFRATNEWRRAEAPGDAYSIGQFVTHVQIAHGRWLRGERLSSRAFLGIAVTHLVRLLRKYVPADVPEEVGSIDPLRRFELAYGALGAALNAALDQPLPAAAHGLLALAKQELAARMPDFPTVGFDVVRRRMARDEAVTA